MRLELAPLTTTTDTITIGDPPLTGPVAVPVHAVEGQATEAEHKVYNIVHLIYRAKNHEVHSKDYEFSRLSMNEHWRAGYHDAKRSLRHPEVLERPTDREGVFTFDLADDGRE